MSRCILKSSRYIILLYAVQVFLLACAPIRPYSSGYSSNTRWKLHDKGNLISDASFETLSQTSWTGTNCKVATIGHEGSQSLILEGEPNQDSRCISPIIQILPGHYESSMWIKTKGLQLTPERHLNEVLSIRLRLFDQHGVEVNPQGRFLGQTIDVQEFNYPLNRIDRDSLVDPLGFTKIHFIPRYHPFDYGWIQPGAQSAQFEIILHGAGKVWFDDLNFSYSKWNFPLVERVKHLGMNQGNAAHIFPRPRILKEWGKPITIKTQAPQNEKIDIRTEIASIPEASENQEAYAIDTSSLSSPQKIILVKAPTQRGLAYGLQTVQQIIHPLPNGDTQVDAVNIVDFPQIPLRAASGRDKRAKQYRQEIEAGKWLPESRFNALIIESHSEKSWWPPNEPAIQAIQEIQLHDPNGLIETGILINPYLFQKELYRGGSFPFSDTKLRELLSSVIQSFHPKHVILATDDFAPHKEGEKFGYILERPEDQKRFRSLGIAHADLTTFLLGRLQQESPETHLYFVPPWYNNIFTDLSNGDAQQYFQDLIPNIPPEVPILWTGPTVRSLFIDQVQQHRYMQLLQGRTPMLWDNTLHARREKDYWGQRKGRAFLASHFEPYDVSLPNPGNFYSNSQLTELYRIQLATLGDYLWNPDNYQPEQSLWNYLVNRFGSKAAGDLLEFESHVWKYRDLCLSWENPLAASLEEQGKEKEKEQQKDLLLKQFADLEKLLGKKEKSLLEELKELLPAESVRQPNSTKENPQ